MWDVRATIIYSFTSDMSELKESQDSHWHEAPLSTIFHAIAIIHWHSNISGVAEALCYCHSEHGARLKPFVVISVSFVCSHADVCYIWRSGCPDALEQWSSQRLSLSFPIFILQSIFLYLSISSVLSLIWKILDSHACFFSVHLQWLQNSHWPVIKLNTW